MENARKGPHREMHKGESLMTEQNVADQEMMIRMSMEFFSSPSFKGALPTSSSLTLEWNSMEQNVADQEMIRISVERFSFSFRQELTTSDQEMMRQGSLFFQTRIGNIRPGNDEQWFSFLSDKNLQHQTRK